jgi:hypothetical protein
MSQKKSITASYSYKHRDSSAGLFFFLTYLFTWSFHIAIPVNGLAFSFDITRPAMLLYLIGLLGPLAAALFLSARFGGWAGVKQLLKGALHWRFNPIWYLFAIVTKCCCGSTIKGIMWQSTPCGSYCLTLLILYIPFLYRV